MKFTKLLLACATFALGIASAASNYHVTLNDPAWVGGNQLKPGDYKVEVMDGKVVFKMGKTVVEAPAKTENAAAKYDTTSVQVNRANGKPVLEEIHVGGTSTKIILQQGATAGGSE